jgi:hypothetical protein
MEEWQEKLHRAADAVVLVHEEAAETVSEERKWPIALGHLHALPPEHLPIHQISLSSSIGWQSNRQTVERFSCRRVIAAIQSRGLAWRCRLQRSSVPSQAMPMRATLHATDEAVHPQLSKAGRYLLQVTQQQVEAWDQEEQQEVKDALRRLLQVIARHLSE